MSLSMRAVLFCVFLMCSVIGHGQVLNPYRYESDFLSADFFKGRRELLRSNLPDSSIAFFFSAPVKNYANDVDYEYHQHPDFYYLSGINEPNAVLVIVKNSISVGGKSSNEFLFIPKRNQNKEIWTGRMPGAEEAASISGISHVLLTTAFDKSDFSFDLMNEILYQQLAVVADDKSDTCELFELLQSFRKKTEPYFKKTDDYALKKLLAAMREVKQPEEMKLLRKAIDISCIGHLEMMRSLKPGMMEYQVEAVGEFVFRYNGAEEVGYPSICGGGENSCILHYITNRRPLGGDDLILLDMGAEYHGYTADVTRTLPVSGTFTNEQRIIYDLVKEAQDSAFGLCRPGSSFRDPHLAAVSVIKRGLMQLGLIEEEKDYTKYFMHGTSHYLGLDVHDAGTFNNLQPGNVITVEPGIYIGEGSPCDKKWWNIGIRIEDDVLITESGYENLSGSLPRSADEVEAAMKEEPAYLQGVGIR